MKLQHDITTMTTTDNDDDNDKYYSDNYSDSFIPISSFAIVEYILGGFISAISVFGILTNMINILVFRRQGIFSSSSTVSLTALAVSDLCYCIVGASFLPFTVVRVYLDWRDDIIFYETHSGRSGDYFSQISCWVTAFTAFERMISVVLPFQVKSIFTPRRSSLLILCLSISLFGVHFVNLFEELPGWRFEADINMTTYGIPYLPMATINAFFYVLITLRFVSVLIVVVSNVVIIWKVKLSQKFRKATSPPSVTSKQSVSTSSHDTNHPERQDIQGKNTSKDVSNRHQNSSKEMVLLRMIMTISAIFTFCYVMDACYVVVFILIYKFYLSSYYLILDYLGFAVVLLFQTVNSSINAIVYFTMSSRYREDVYSIFKISKKE